MEKSVSGTAQSPRLLPLDALRGIAALFVFAFHYNNMFGLALLIPGTEHIHNFLLGQGWQCVQLFFVVSGFTFYYVYDKKISSHEVSPRDFAVLRLSRLVPLCYLGIVAMLAVRIICRVAFGTVFDVTLTQVFGDFLLINGELLHAGGQPLNTPMWSLTPELFAYIAFFAATWKIKSTPKKLLLYAVITLAVCMQYDRGASVLFLSPNFTRVFAGFFMGCIACALWKHCVEPRAKRVLTWSSAAVAVICLAGQFYSETLIDNYAFVYSVFCFPAIIIAALNIRPLRWVLELRVFRWIGNLSFSIYLLHYPLLYLLRELGRAGVFDLRGMIHIWSISGVLAVVLIAAHLSFYKYEKPMMGWLRHRLIRG
jgi:peptidoglycan/LPS O-acetylase OafA/YrhL